MDLYEIMPQGVIPKKKVIDFVGCDLNRIGFEGQ